MKMLLLSLVLFVGMSEVSNAKLALWSCKADVKGNAKTYSNESNDQKSCEGEVKDLIKKDKNVFKSFIYSKSKK